MKLEHEIMGKYVETKRAEPRDSNRYVFPSTFPLFLFNDYIVYSCECIWYGSGLLLMRMATASAAAMVATTSTTRARRWAALMVVVEAMAVVVVAAVDPAVAEVTLTREVAACKTITVAGKTCF